MNNELLTIPQTCIALNCGKTVLYRRINSGELKAVKMGKKTLVSKKALEDFVASLQPYPSEKQGG